MAQTIESDLLSIGYEAELERELSFVLAEVVHLLEKMAPSIKEEFLRLRTHFIANRANDEASFDEILTSREHTDDLIKAFSLYMMLLNIVEEREERRHKKPELAATIDKLEEEGFDREDIIQTLREIRFYPVFTAHPTESKRRTFLEAHHELSRDIERIFSRGDEEAHEHLRYRLALMWQTELVREEKIEVMFELDNLLYIIESSLLEALDRLNSRIEALTGPIKEPIINLASWVGGDRDGNHFVTNEVMTRVMKTQSELILSLYLKQIDKLIRELSISSSQTTISDELLRTVHQHSYVLSEKDRLMNKNEPFRAMLKIMRLKLENKLLSLHTPTAPEFCYTEPEELISDIDLMLSALEPGSRLSLQKFRNLVLAGGFHLMKLDFREHKDMINSALAEIFSRLGLSDSDYLELDGNKRAEILTSALAMPPLNLAALALKLSEPSRKMTEAFIKFAWAKRRISTRIIDSFIISMTTTASDLLGVLWFAKQAGLWIPGKRADISITPLFETIEDLQQAPTILRQLAANSHYSRYIDDRNREQEIMIGYSDSSKDGGIFASNFNLNRAIVNLMDLSTELEIKFLLFHGRGGSVSRGGGPTHEAILATPAKGVSGFLKLTEQGEVISSKYLNTRIAEYNLTEAITALLEKSVYDKFNIRRDCGKNDRFVDLMGRISARSMDVYRDLIHGTPGFINYFKEATPFSFIEKLNLGSRPSKRRDTNAIEDIRAIPWVFAWTQNRSIIPAWYGVGSGLEEIVMAGGLEELKESFVTCPFFRTTIDKITMGIMKTDLAIAKLYNQFVSNEEHGKVVWSKIVAEHQKTMKYLKMVRAEEKLLEANPQLRQSILLRKPYLTALGLLQVELIKKYREARYDKKRHRIEKMIASTIVAISLGIRNTG